MRKSTPSREETEYLQQGAPNRNKMTSVMRVKAWRMVGDKGEAGVRGGTAPAMRMNVREIGGCVGQRSMIIACRPGGSRPRCGSRLQAPSPGPGTQSTRSAAFLARLPWTYTAAWSTWTARSRPCPTEARRSHSEEARGCPTCQGRCER
jgi:hypothetical protein